MKRMLFILLLSLLTSHVDAQHSINYVSEFASKYVIQGANASGRMWMDMLVQRTNYLIKKHPLLKKMRGLHQYHIVHIIPTSLFVRNSEFYDYSFLRKTNVCLYSPKGKDTYMRDITLITDSVGCLVAMGDAWQLVANYSTSPIYIELARLFYNEEVDVIFVTDDFFLNEYFCIKGGELFVLEVQENQLIRHTWHEFLDANIRE